MNRVCKKCGAEKELTNENFRPHGHSPGNRGTCRECERKNQKVRYDANPEKVCAASRKWVREHKEQHAATKRKWCKANPGKHNASRRKVNYGISNEQFLELFKQQEGKCAICGFVFPGIDTGNRVLSPHVDHDHVTGKIRGLLCSSCNTGLGRFKDSVARIQKAIWYLQKVG